MRKPKHLKHIFGILLGFVLIIFGTIFALWQLDIIVSGCVWHENPDGSGWAWHDGAYAKAYFQCFLWKTTIGQAYDTLFLLDFILPTLGAILIFVSVWYWYDEQKCPKCNHIF